MDEPYISLVFMLILNIYLSIILKLKRMVYFRSSQKLESKNTQVFIYYHLNRMKIGFQKKSRKWENFPFFCKWGNFGQA